MWRGVTSLPDYKSSFPKWPRQQLDSVIKAVPAEGIDLIEVQNNERLLPYICLRNISPMARTVYCDKNFAERVHYPVECYELFACTR